ncbi:metallophosphoesterase family protein [Aeromicrobium massiliense]|uniref:metallophosphoesterase family protein n=1 Tax=Aeromicrobium massiliense TaxID=1464554 RepID=UPI0003186CA3|nr:exonuclease SbcCD subunit D [Aeromicrobium massiliense]
MRFVATADWQIGMTAHFLEAEARPRFAQARLDAVRATGRVAAEHGAAFVLVCGDVFESNQLDRQVVGRAFDALRDVPVPVWLLPGNHDPLDAASVYRSPEFLAGCPEHVHVLDRPGLHEVAPGAELVAAPWYSKRPLSDLVADALEGLEPPAPGVARVVAGHGSVVGFDRTNPSTISEPGLTAALDAGLAHVAVLGDRHSTTRVTDRVWYPGAPEVTSRLEDDPGNVLVVDVADDGAVSVEPVRVGSWRFVAHQARLDSSADLDDLERWLREQPAKERTAVWLSLTGTLSVAEKARLDALLDDAGSLYALLDLWARHTDLAVRPADGDMDELGLTGFAREAVDELVARSADDPAAQDALSLLYRLASAGAR